MYIKCNTPCSHSLYITHTHTHTHMCAHTHTHMCAHTHVRTHTHTCAHTHTRAHTHTHVRTHTHTHARTHTHVRTHTRVRTHAHQIRGGFRGSCKILVCMSIVLCMKISTSSGLPFYFSHLGTQTPPISVI